MGFYYHSAFVAYENLTRWIFYHENPPCVKKIINNDYWHSLTHVRVPGPDDAPYLLLLVTIIAVLAANILLCTLYFRKWAKEASIVKSSNEFGGEPEDKIIQ